MVLKVRMKSMLKNIVFDMGNVLITYDPAYFIRRAGVACPQDQALLLSAVFNSADWPLLDLGTLTEAELLPRACKRLPERLHSAARELIFNWNRPLMPIAGMAELVRDCKRAGLGVYLLSNASRRQREYWHSVPGSEYFDGTVISALQGCVKPAPEIYEYLLKHFGLSADECLFVDDVAENVRGAERIGMRGFQFCGDAAALRKTIQAMLADGRDALC